MKSTTESLTRRHFTSDCCTVKLTLVQRVSDGDRNGEDAIETWIFTDTQCHASGQGQVLLQSLSLLSYTLTSLKPAPSSVPHPSPHSPPQGQVLLQSMPVHCCTYTQTFCDAWSRWCRLLYGCMWNDLNSLNSSWYRSWPLSMQHCVMSDRIRNTAVRATLGKTTWIRNHAIRATLGKTTLLRNPAVRATLGKAMQMLVD